MAVAFVWRAHSCAHFEVDSQGSAPTKDSAHTLRTAWTMACVENINSSPVVSLEACAPSKSVECYQATSKHFQKTGIVATELEKIWELPHELPNRKHNDSLLVYGTDGTGTFLKVFINRLINRQAQVSLLFILPDGTTYRLPNAPDTLISNIDGRKSFNAAGVKFQLLEAMRRWRILFNGTAVRTRVDGETAEVHLRINLIWSAFSRPFERKREFSRKLLASAMARELWRGRKEWSSMCDPLLNGFDQWGAMTGTYQDSSIQPVEKEIYLRGLRQRRWG